MLNQQSNPKWKLLIQNQIMLHEQQKQQKCAHAANFFNGLLANFTHQGQKQEAETEDPLIPSRIKDACSSLENALAHSHSYLYLSATQIIPIIQPAPSAPPPPPNATSTTVFNTKCRQSIVVVLKSLETFQHYQNKFKLSLTGYKKFLVRQCLFDWLARILQRLLHLGVNNLEGVLYGSFL